MAVGQQGIGDLLVAVLAIGFFFLYIASRYKKKPMMDVLVEIFTGTKPAGTVAVVPDIKEGAWMRKRPQS